MGTTKEKPYNFPSFFNNCDSFPKLDFTAELGYPSIAEGKFGRKAFDGIRIDHIGAIVIKMHCYYGTHTTIKTSKYTIMRHSFPFSTLHCFALHNCPYKYKYLKYGIAWIRSEPFSIICAFGTKSNMVPNFIEISRKMGPVG